MSVSQRLPFVPRVLVALMSVLLVLVVSVTHALAQSSEPVSTGSLDSTSDDLGEPIAPGDEVTLAGSGFAPGARIDIVIESDPIFLASTQADATGSFEVTVSIPTEGLPPGDHMLKATGPDATGGLRVLSVPVEIAATATISDTSGTLPTTGGDLLSLTAVGAGIVLLGGLLVQRRHPSR